MAVLIRGRSRPQSTILHLTLGTPSPNSSEERIFLHCISEAPVQSDSVKAYGEPPHNGLGHLRFNTNMLHLMPNLIIRTASGLIPKNHD